MKLSHMNLRRLINYDLSMILDESKDGAAYPGQLGVGTPAGESGGSSDEESDVESEIQSTNAQIGAIDNNNTDPKKQVAAQQQKKVLQRQLSMLQQKSTNDADVIGEGEIVKITRRNLRTLIREQFNLIREQFSNISDLQEEPYKHLYDVLVAGSREWLKGADSRNPKNASYSLGFSEGSAPNPKAVGEKTFLLEFAVSDDTETGIYVRVVPGPTFTEDDFSYADMRDNLQWEIDNLTIDSASDEMKIALKAMNDAFKAAKSPGTQFPLSQTIVHTNVEYDEDEF